MRKRLSLLTIVALFAFGGAAYPGLAFAAGGERVAQEETGEEDEGTDYGWIGLLGLAGLAGLLGRKRDDRDRTTTTTGARTDR